MSMEQTMQQRTEGGSSSTSLHRNKFCWLLPFAFVLSSVVVFSCYETKRRMSSSSQPFRSRNDHDPHHPKRNLAAAAVVQPTETILYYNQKRHLEGDETTTATAATPLEGYPKGGPVIATLVTNLPNDVNQLQNALQSLSFLRGDIDPAYPAPVLIFHEGDLSQPQKRSLADSTNRPVAFPTVDFTSFPPGFDPTVEEPAFRVKGRKEWGYYQMIRFWVTGIWKHPALEPYETVMRIDSDSCFMEDNPILPNLPPSNDDIVYHSQYVGFEPSKDTVVGLYDMTVDWMKSVDKMPGNPMMWQFLQTTWEQTQTLPVLRTNFEVSRKSFVQKNDVYRWLELLTEKEPFGIYRHRWGDAVIRFMMVAIFAQNHMVVLSRPAGYAHKELCDEETYWDRYRNVG